MSNYYINNNKYFNIWINEIKLDYKIHNNLWNWIVNNTYHFDADIGFHYGFDKDILWEDMNNGKKLNIKEKEIIKDLDILIITYSCLKNFDYKIEKQIIEKLGYVKGQIDGIEIENCNLSEKELIKKINLLPLKVWLKDYEPTKYYYKKLLKEIKTIEELENILDEIYKVIL